MESALTYAGVFDDQVYRYPNTLTSASVLGKDKRDKYFNELLLRSLSLGKPLAVNDFLCSSGVGPRKLER